MRRHRVLASAGSLPALAAVIRTITGQAAFRIVPGAAAVARTSKREETASGLLLPCPDALEAGVRFWHMVNHSSETRAESETSSLCLRAGCPASPATVRSGWPCTWQAQRCCPAERRRRILHPEVCGQKSRVQDAEGSRVGGGGKHQSALDCMADSGKLRNTAGGQGPRAIEAPGRQNRLNPFGEPGAATHGCIAVTADQDNVNGDCTRDVKTPHIPSSHWTLAGKWIWSQGRGSADGWLPRGGRAALFCLPAPMQRPGLPLAVPSP